MTTMTDLEKKQAREQAALQMRQERERALASIVYPKRKTGEMNKLAVCAKTASALLETYDVQESPPPIADLLLHAFNELIARLNKLTSTQPASA